MAPANGGAAGVGTGIPAPDFAAWGINDATAQLGMQLGHSAVAAGQEYMQRNVSSFGHLRFCDCMLTSL